MRKLFAAAVVLTSACGGSLDPLSEQSDDLTQCPGAHTQQGIDVSVWQGHIDWPSVARSGRSFAIARVSDGLSVDSTFQRNYAGIKQAGMVRGAYQFFRSRESAVAQADLLIREIGSLQPGDLPPTLDVEVTDGSSPAVMAAGARAWSDRIAARLGRRPIIYSGSYFWDDDVRTSSLQDLLWLPAWGPTCPRLPNAWSKWTLHQYADNGTVPGISGRVDLDLFDGSRADLEALAGHVSCAAHCEGSVLVGKDCGRGDCGAFGARCVDDSLGARCVFSLCPAQGSAEVCLSEKEAGHCVNGALVSRGDCSAYGAFCSTAGTSAHAARCVSAFCAANASEAPVAHEGCFLHGEKLHCDENGAATETACAAGTQCSVLGGVHCAAAVCPAAGKADVCADAHSIGHCSEASVLSATSCGSDAYCSTAGRHAPHCASDKCVSGPAEVPAAHDLCLSASLAGHCDSGGALKTQACAAGSACRAGLCEPVGSPDAGTAPPDAGVGQADAGAPDAGSGGADAGVGDADAGSGSDDVDAGDPAPLSDAGPDAIWNQPDPDAPGAGCSSAGGPGIGALLALALVARRRRA